jgi:hypothetical protein
MTGIIISVGIDQSLSLPDRPNWFFDVLPRLKTRESHGTAPLSWDITVRGSRPVLVG